MGFPERLFQVNEIVAWSPPVKRPDDQPYKAQQDAFTSVVIAVRANAAHRIVSRHHCLQLSPDFAAHLVHSSCNFAVFDGPQSQDGFSGDKTQQLTRL